MTLKLLRSSLLAAVTLVSMLGHAEPAQAASPFVKGGQAAWFHDPGFGYGFFHTYDALDVSDTNAPHKVHVFVPRDYEVSGRSYPVVYMNDGNTTFWPGGAAGKSWQVASTLTSLSNAGLIEDVIVVAIEPVNREYEYTHVDWASGTQPWGGLDAYADYLADDVKGWVDDHYRTWPEAEHTAIVGSSHGGLAAFYTAGTRPDAFGLAGCLSSSFWAGLDNLVFNPFPGNLATSDLLDATGGVLADPDARPTLWIDWGMRRDGGFHNSVIEAYATTRSLQMVDLLQQTYGYATASSSVGHDPAVELYWHQDPIGGHDEDAWAWRFGLMMQAFYPAS